MLGNIIAWIVLGAIIGLLARLVLPGKQNISVAITIVLGIIGAVVGGLIANALGVGDTNGIDWIKLIISVVVAAALVTGYGAITGKKV
ncbi:GlsB/YeaQ/YmgE family stress response membrane protein [Calidifontibacter terrae]